MTEHRADNRDFSHRPYSALLVAALGALSVLGVLGVLGVAHLVVGQDPVQQLPPAKKSLAPFSEEYDTVERNALDKQRLRDVRRISLHEASAFHRRLVRTLAPVLPENVRFRNHGPLASETGGRKGITVQVDESTDTSPLSWTVEGDLGIFGFWISTARTESTVVVCQIEKRMLFVNVDFVADFRSVDEKLPELGGLSVRKALQLLERACEKQS